MGGEEVTLTWYWWLHLRPLVQSLTDFLQSKFWKIDRYLKCRQHGRKVSNTAKQEAIHCLCDHIMNSVVSPIGVQ